MKRHPSLQPFSRDHNNGLILARELDKASRGERNAEVVADSLRRGWELEMRDHFEEEERLLGPLMTPEQLSRMQQEHEAIAALVTSILSPSEHKSTSELVQSQSTLATALEAHIRWEERELFPALEATNRMEQIEEETWLLEERHAANGLSPRRAELVKRTPKV
jgi:hemerythrin